MCQGHRAASGESTANSAILASGTELACRGQDANEVGNLAHQLMGRLGTRCGLRRSRTDHRRHDKPRWRRHRWNRRRREGRRFRRLGWSRWRYQRLRRRLRGRRQTESAARSGSVARSMSGAPPASGARRISEGPAVRSVALVAQEQTAFSFAITHGPASAPAGRQRVTSSVRADGYIAPNAVTVARACRGRTCFCRRTMRGPMGGSMGGLAARETRIARTCSTDGASR